MIKTKLLLALCTALLLTACGKEPSSSITKQAIINQISTAVIQNYFLDKNMVKLDLADYAINEQSTSGTGNDIRYIYQYTATTKSKEYQTLLNDRIVCGKIILGKQDNGNWNVVERIGSWNVGGRIGSC